MELDEIRPRWNDPPMLLQRGFPTTPPLFIDTSLDEVNDETEIFATPPTLLKNTVLYDHTNNYKSTTKCTTFDSVERRRKNSTTLSTVTLL